MRRHRKLLLFLSLFALALMAALVVLARRDAQKPVVQWQAWVYPGAKLVRQLDTNSVMVRQFYTPDPVAKVNGRFMAFPGRPPGLMFVEYHVLPRFLSFLGDRKCRAFAQLGQTNGSEFNMESSDGSVVAVQVSAAPDGIGSLLTIVGAPATKLPANASLRPPIPRSAQLEGGRSGGVHAFRYSTAESSADLQRHYAALLGFDSNTATNALQHRIVAGEDQLLLRISPTDAVIATIGSRGMETIHIGGEATNTTYVITRGGR